MSAANESENIVTSPFTASSGTTFETPSPFMDASGFFVFRAYLTESPPDDRGPTIIAAALSKIISNGGTRSNEQLYDEMHSVLCGPEPLEAEHLLRFMCCCIGAIQSQVRLAATVASTQPRTTAKEQEPTFPIGAPTSLYLAEQFPDSTLKRLDSWERFSKEHTLDAEIYALSDFLACTDAEISGLLDLTPKRVKQLRVHAFSNVCENDPQ